ncbi:interleukin-6 receptor subunit beta isoform X2 [Centroberyx affinis]|uniref:interleukin-6 receptor subunit beta isoform X2 n=1 Tax=Centroberyx affinis TaxID=166261 RepID=UPI003A5C0FD4
MMILLDFPQHLMDQLKGWSSLHGFTAMFMLLTVVSKGSACEAPSGPQCFRRSFSESVYRCEWSMNTSASDVTYDLYFNTTESPFKEKEFEGIDKNWISQLREEALIKDRPVYIWVTAHTGISSCTSPRTSVVLSNTVKYEAPQTISVSWLKNNLSLSWKAAEEQPALAEVRFRREDTTESWENRITETNTPKEPLMYQVNVVNLRKRSSYQVQVRQRSIQAKNPLWSDWSAVQTVPAELEHQPEVNLTTREFNNGTRMLILTWKVMPHAAAVGGVYYSMTDTQSSHGCPCPKKKKNKQVKTTEYSTYVTDSFVNISVIATNAAGASPAANVLVPAKPAKDLKTCDKPLPEVKVPQRTCLEWYELQNGKTMPETVKTFKARHNITTPRIKPQGFTALCETCCSAELSWKAIPTEEQQGFLTHYAVCSMKTSPHDEAEECHNVPASSTEYRLENLTPGSRYNISLAGVTRAGAGPKAFASINTAPENPVNVWLSLGLLSVFFLASILCTFILKRIKNRIFPPVPIPVILTDTFRQGNQQEMLEIKEEVHELMLQPEGKSVPMPEDLEETTVLGEVWETDDAAEEDMEHERILGDSTTSEGASDECLSPGYKSQVLRRSRDSEVTDLGQGDEITMLIYRNGLVFDVKADSS